jgi:hypothetical protein
VLKLAQYKIQKEESEAVGHNCYVIDLTLYCVSRIKEGELESGYILGAAIP